jgi:hypothetical protein
MTTSQHQLRQTTIVARHSSHLALLANPDWESAQAIHIDLDWEGKPASAEKQATAQLLWTEAALLVRFVGRQAGPPLVNSNPQTEKKTLGLWDKDVCEIFVAPDPNRPECYFEFEAAPSGEWVDLGIEVNSTGRDTDRNYHSGMSVEAESTEGQITIGMRLPWSSSLPKPKSGDVWRVNLFRCVGTGNERYLAWQPTHTPEPYFHVPEVFGWLEFI